MKYLLKSVQMKSCDQNTIEYFKIPSIVLMERAALALSGKIRELFPCPEKTSVLCVCGTGNNGGDGIAAARLLFLAGYRVDILLPGKEEKFSEQARLQYEAALMYKIPVYKELPERGYTVIIDAIFGIGLDRDIKGDCRKLIEELNERKSFKTAADIASGVAADDGRILGCAFKADLTVTFGFAKIGQILYPGRMYTGELVTADIGIDENSLPGEKPKVRLLEDGDLSALPERKAFSNKGTCGRVLILAGSYNMAGAAVLASKAAYSAGAGMVKTATDAENRIILQTAVPEAILSTYGPHTSPKEYIRELLPWADCAAAGPGMGISAMSAELVKALLEEAQVPLVLDADALNIIAEHPDYLEAAKAPVIVTPHIGEMSRLIKKSAEYIKADPIGCAEEFSKTYNVVTVLKDAVTVTAAPDGEVHINDHGNAGMATAGSGDVLTGITASLLAQGMEAGKAAYTAVLLHAMAGDAAALAAGKRPLTASGIVGGITDVLREM